MIPIIKEKSREKNETDCKKIIFEEFNLNPICNQILLEIILDEDYEKFINVYKINNDNSGADVEESILEALSKGITALILIFF